MQAKEVTWEEYHVISRNRVHKYIC